MEISNELVEESMSYQISGKNISSRIEDLQTLDEILEYCKKINESVCYGDEIWNVEVEEDSRECSLDPKHRSELIFRFQYEEDVQGQIVKHEKMVECQPHLKLIRKDSDLRIYFYWKDSQVGNGEKVLIGRVGRHGWNK